MVLAGNPYTGSGERFELPDMLVNRSDVHNLGDVVAGRADLFARSYLEVAAGSNSTLAPVVLGDRSDLDVFLRATQGEPVEAERAVPAVPGGGRAGHHGGARPPRARCGTGCCR